MTFVAWLLVWLALAVGLLQVLICGIKLLSSGWAVPIVFILMLLPVLPLILMQEIRGGRSAGEIPGLRCASSGLRSAGCSQKKSSRMRKKC